MKKLLKFLLILAGAAVVLAGLAAVALRVYFPPEKIRQVLLTQGEKALHRKLEIKDVSVGLWSGLRVEGLRVSELPDFSAGEFLKADALSVRIELAPLLRRQVIVREVALEGADVRLILRKDKTYNFQDLMGAATATPVPPSTAKDAAAPGAAPGAAALPVALLVDSIRVTGRLSYEDRIAKAATKIEGIDARVRGLKLSGAFPVEAKAKVDYRAGPARYAVALSAQGELDLAGLDMSALNGSLKKLEVTVNGVTMTGEARFKGAVKNEVEGSLAFPALTSETLAQLGGTPVPAGLSVPPSKISFALVYSSPSLNVSSFAAELAGLKAEGKAKVPNVLAKNLSFSVDLETNQFDLKPLAEISDAAKSFGVVGRGRLKLKASGTAVQPKVDGTLELSGAGASPMQQKLEGFSGTAAFTMDSVDVPSLTGKINGGELKLKLSAGHFAAPVVAAEGSLTVLDAGALMAAFPPAPAAPAKPAAPPPPAPPYKGPVLKTTGRLTVGKILHPNFSGSDADLSWDLSGVTPEMKLLDGKAGFKMGSGKATDLLKLMDQHKAMKAMLYPLVALDKARALKIPGLKLPSMNEIAYTKVEGDYVFKKGVMTMQPFLIDGPDFYADSRGDVDLAAQKADLKMTARIPGLASVVLNVKGPLTDPSVTPDLSKVAHEAQQKAVEEIKKQIAPKAGELLKGLFK